jgi:WD40 repeat protein
METVIHLTTNKMYVGNPDRIIVYDILTRKEDKEIELGGDCYWDISQSRDGKCLFFACGDGTARIINLFTGKEVILRGHTSFVRCIIQGEGTDVLTGSWDSTIRRWNSTTGECVMIYEGTGWVYSILYDEATKRIFSASSDKTIIVWNGDTGEKVGVIEGHRRLVRSLVRVNATTIASGSASGMPSSESDDETIKLWDIATLVCIKTMRVGGYPCSVAATSDGQYLISGSLDRKVEVWSIATGQCLHALSHHSGSVYKVAVSPDGRFIASSGKNDHMVHLFSVSPPFSFSIREDVLVHDDTEIHLSLFSDGAIRCNDDLIATVASASTRSLVSDNPIVANDSDSADLTAKSASVAQLWTGAMAHLWTEAMASVSADLALHPDDRARSADQMIHRYRFNLLQTILFHVREADFRRHVPREIAQIIGGYIMQY